MKFHFLSSNNPEAKNTEKKLTELFGQNSVEDADYIIPIGCDGLLLKSLHNFNKLNKPFFGINFGSIGFLMNNLSNENLNDMIGFNGKKKIPFKERGDLENQLWFHVQGFEGIANETW